jgi:hypothetical protein
MLREHQPSMAQERGLDFKASVRSWALYQAAIQSATRSAIMITVAWAPPDLGMRGMTDASATHKASIPLTLQN